MIVNAKLLGFLPLVLGCTPALAATLDVTVENIRPGQGSVVLCLWRDGAGFPDCDKHRPAQKKSSRAEKATQTTTFENVPDGVYAVGVALDLNGNGRVDTNFLGIPKEPVSVSNGAKGTLGAPKFKDASFPLSGRKKIVIRM